MLKNNFIFLFVIIILFTISGCNEAENSKYIATTRWVAAVVELGGVNDVQHFAPSEMTHPPEYELKPNDIVKLANSEFVFYAGYEKKMVEKINDSMGNNKFEIIQIKTQNSFETLKEEAEKISKKFNTESQCEKNIIKLESVFTDFTDYLKDKKLYNKNGYVHVFQVPLAKTLGFNIAGTFGPGPVTSEQLKEVSKLKPDIIIDNYHNQVAGPFKEVSKDSVIVSLINFPGLFETETIFDVLEYNKNQF